VRSDRELRRRLARGRRPAFAGRLELTEDGIGLVGSGAGRLLARRRIHYGELGGVRVSRASPDRVNGLR